MHGIARSNLALLTLVIALAPVAAHADGTHPLGGTLEGMAKASPAPPAVFAPGVYPGAAKPGVAFDGYATVAYALTHAPTLLAQRATVLNLDSQFTKARAAEYPTATGELQNQIQKQGNSSGQFAQFGITPTSNFSQNTAELSSTYNLFNGTAQIAAQQAKRQVDNAKFELQRQEEQTAIAVTNAFYALAANRENVVVDEGDLAYQRDLLATAVAEEHVGRVAGVDVLRAQVAVERSSRRAPTKRTRVKRSRCRSARPRKRSSRCRTSYPNRRYPQPRSTCSVRSRR
jgi:outer membrane protein TolC